MKDSEIDKVLFIKLKKSSGQKFLSLINRIFDKTSVIDQKIKILHESNHVLFPLIEDDVLIDALKKSIGNDMEYQLIKKDGILNQNFKPKSIIDALKGEIKKEFLDLIPKSYDIIGDIAIIEIDDVESLNEKEFVILKNKIAKTLTIVNKNVKSVYEKKSEIKSSYRLRELLHLYGEKKTTTIHRENNCVFKVDLSNAFFTPRLVFERKRIASSNIKQKEIIVDLFAGVGPYSIQIAKNHDVTIHSFDVNPHAYEQLKENIKLNKIRGEIIPHNIDVENLLTPTNELGALLKHKIDRIIMNLPEKSIDFIKIACFLMKNQTLLKEQLKIYRKV